ncbi:hypothetical protein BG58_03545 [Caballeronia jiangsuensis]|nr:hypothetical protein BG58_03545 [Caballeronia jiangsuensis]
MKHSMIFAIAFMLASGAAARVSGHWVSKVAGDGEKSTRQFADHMRTLHRSFARHSYPYTTR